MGNLLRGVILIPLLLKRWVNDIQCPLWSWCHYFWKSCFTLCPGLNPYADPSLKPTTPSPLRSPAWVFARLDPLLKPYGRAAPGSWNSKLWQAWRENDNTSRSLEKMDEKQFLSAEIILTFAVFITFITSILWHFSVYYDWKGQKASVYKMQHSQQDKGQNFGKWVSIC